MATFRGKEIDVQQHRSGMDPSPVRISPIEEDDMWDTDGFVIPSLEIADNSPKVEDSSNDPAKKEEVIHLRPQGAPPSQAKQQEQISSTRKQKFKQKLKEADRRHSGTERENKVDNLRDLVGVGKTHVSMSNNSTRDWLDPHCHESEFETRNH